MSNLQPYVDHLLEDIKKASRHPKPKKVHAGDEGSLEAHLKEVEAFVEQTGWQPLENICGLDPDTFPAANKLTQEQQVHIINAIHEMFKSWNVEATIPKKVPTAMAYNLLLGLLSKGIPHLEHGFVVFDFCTGVPDGCELGEYCPCLEFYKDTQDEELGRKQD